jgi:hypothetical protein
LEVSKICVLQTRHYRAVLDISALFGCNWVLFFPIGRDEEYVKLFAEEFMGSLAHNYHDIP